MYRMVYPSVTHEKSYRIHDHHQITIPVHWSVNGDTKIVSISWDENKTRIVSAKLYVKVYSDIDGTYLTYHVNKTEVIRLAWYLGEIGVWKEDEKDVLAYIRNGDNRFDAIYGKALWFPWVANAYVTAILTLTFEGEPPEVSPPTAPFPWQDYAKAGAIGAMIIGGASTLYSLMVHPEKTLMEHAQTALIGSIAGAIIGLGVRYLIGG